VKFQHAMSAYPAKMIGTDNRRIHLAVPLLRGRSAGITGSIVGALTRSSSRRGPAGYGCALRNVPVWHLAQLLPAAMHPSKRYQIRTLAGGQFTVDTRDVAFSCRSSTANDLELSGTDRFSPGAELAIYLTHTN